MQRIFVGALLAFGAEGAMFGSRIGTTVGTGGTATIPAGAWLVECDSNSVVKFSYDAGTTWVTQIAASGVGIVASDGFNVAFVGGSAPGTAYRSQILNWQ